MRLGLSTRALKRRVVAQTKLHLGPASCECLDAMKAYAHNRPAVSDFWVWTSNVPGAARGGLWRAGFLRRTATTTRRRATAAPAGRGGAGRRTREGASLVALLAAGGRRGEGGSNFSPVVVLTERGRVIEVESIMLAKRQLEQEVCGKYVAPGWLIKDHDMAENVGVTRQLFATTPGAPPCLSCMLALLAAHPHAFRELGFVRVWAP